MSASLDDMPEYERFQDELDLELSRYKNINSITDIRIENNFIQYVCFSLCIKNADELSDVILQTIFKEFKGQEKTIIYFIQFVNDNPDSFLKNRFTIVLQLMQALAN
jgi:hypothetical protein